jgi:glycosidase
MANGVDPWLPFPAESATRNYASQRADPTSILHLYRRLIALRRQHPALTLGAFAPLEAPEGVLAYRRAFDDDVCTVMINFTDAEIEVGDPSSFGSLSRSQGGIVAVSSDGSVDGARFDGRLRPDQAVVLLT